VLEDVRREAPLHENEAAQVLSVCRSRCREYLQCAACIKFYPDNSMLRTRLQKMCINDRLSAIIHSDLKCVTDMLAVFVLIRLLNPCSRIVTVISHTDYLNRGLILNPTAPHSAAHTFSAIHSK
jgi:hypothetical protein